MPPRHSYSDLLNDPRWKALRLKVIARDGGQCINCASRGDEEGRADGIRLEVHHGIYLPGRAPWDTWEETLYTLCTSCHGLAEDHKWILKKRMAHIHPVEGVKKLWVLADHIERAHVVTARIRREQSEGAWR